MTFIRSTALLDVFWEEVARDDARKSGRTRPTHLFHPSAGNCILTSCMLADLLSSEGVDAAPVSGMIWARLAGAPDAWPMAASDHTALRVDDLIVDLTRQQFEGEGPGAWLLSDPAIAVFEDRPHAYLRKFAGTTGMNHAFVTALRRPNALGQVNSLGLIMRQLGTDFAAEMRDAIRAEIADVRLNTVDRGPSTPSIC